MRLNLPVAERNPTRLFSLRRGTSVSGALLSLSASIDAPGGLPDSRDGLARVGQVRPLQDAQEIAITGTSCNPCRGRPANPVAFHPVEDLFEVVESLAWSKLPVSAFQQRLAGHAEAKVIHSTRGRLSDKESQIVKGWSG